MANWIITRIRKGGKPCVVVCSRCGHEMNAYTFPDTCPKCNARIHGLIDRYSTPLQRIMYRIADYKADRAYFKKNGLKW